MTVDEIINDAINQPVYVRPNPIGGGPKPHKHIPVKAVDRKTGEIKTFCKTCFKPL